MTSGEDIIFHNKQMVDLLKINKNRPIEEENNLNSSKDSIFGLIQEKLMLVKQTTDCNIS